MPALTNQQAIASAVLATIGIVIPFALSIAAVVLAFRARATERANPALGGKTLILIGLGLGLFGIAEWTYVTIRIAAR